MTDYLEEHLGGVEALLEWIRQLEQKESGLSWRSISGENVDHMGHFAENAQDNEPKGDLIFLKKKIGCDIKREVDQPDYLVYQTDATLKKRDIDVSHKVKSGSNTRDLRQIVASSRTEGTQAGGERGESLSPLSAQLEELDRAVSALTTPIPEGRETARVSYPVSLPGPQNLLADPNLIGVPGDAWRGLDAAAGADFAYGGRQTWAEQADRMFRRDSRRYDGGFTLY